METQTLNAPPDTIMVGPAEGSILKAFGDTMNIKLGQNQTGGSLTVCLDTTPPGSGPPPHRHRDDDELFLIVEGRYSFLANGEWVEAVPGSVVYARRGGVHAFKNIGDTPARMWIITTPCGFESFFEKSAAVFSEAGAGPPDLQRIISISSDHGIEYVPPLG